MAFRNFETLKDYNRIEPNFRRSLVTEVLPEYFATSYPNLVAFLEGYYEFLDSDANFGGAIQELLTIRDIQDTNLQRLDFIFDEIGLGIAGGQFIFPREVIRNFGEFFRVKGSLFSAEGFFRAFFNEQVEILYPKDRLLIIGERPIGPDDDYLIQDGAIYQIFSVLIRSPISFNTWGDLYRKFVHPAGFHLAAEVEVVGSVGVPITTTQSITDPEPNELNIQTTVQANLGLAAEGEATLLIDQDSTHIPNLYGFLARMNPYDTLSSLDSDLGPGATLTDLNRFASDLNELGGYRQTMDDSSNSVHSALRYSNTNATFDQRVYIYYNEGYIARGYVQKGYVGIGLPK